jgi:LacI family transcriptional regulator, lactose operon repressor
LIPSDKRKRITLKDVAQKAGVSTQTVSRVINKFSFVSRETRQRVEAVVEQLGYRPNMLARSLSQQRSYTLGIVTFDLRYIGTSRTLSGIADKADELGYMLLIKELNNVLVHRIDDVIDSLLARQVDGILWTVPEIGDNHAWIEKRIQNIPVPILFVAMQPREGIPSVATDNFQGAVVAVLHLLDCKRKKIGHISGPAGWWEADERKRGWRETLGAAGFQTSEQHWAQGDWSSASGEQALDQLLESFPDMDAVFVANDQMALSVLREVCRRGIRIPEQLAVIGFDDIPESNYFSPSLTTISQDLHLLGEKAVQAVVELIRARQENNPFTAQSLLITPKLVVRESSRLV